MQAGHGSGVYIRVPSVVEDRVMETLRVTNPATGELIQEIPAADAAAADAAMARAREAQPAWGGLPFSERSRILRRVARTLRDDATFLDTLCAESGKPRYEAENIELFYTLELTRYYTGRAGRRALADDLRHPFVFLNKRARVVHHPRGVVAVIGPWNWPLLNNYADCIGAPGRRQRGRAEAVRAHADDLAAGRRAGPRRGPPRRRVPGRRGPRRRGRRADRGRRHDLLHRQRRDRPARRPGGGRTLDPRRARAGRQVPDDRARRRRPAARRARRGLERVRAQRPGVHPHRARASSRPPSRIASSSWPPPRSRGCARRHRRSGSRMPPTSTSARSPSRRRSNGRSSRSPTPSPAAARVVTGGARRKDLPGQFFAPTLIADATPDMAVMREETFGPVLPVMRVARRGGGAARGERLARWACPAASGPATPDARPRSPGGCRRAACA